VKVPWTQKKATKKDDRGLDLHFEDIGYASRHLILDTKDFYVPQTRQRGYLIAIHKLSFDGTEEELNEQLDLWEKDMQKLKRPASVPAESLLLKSDDPKLKFSQIEDFEQKKKATQWDKCKIGHQKYRSNINIGLDHPITNWSAGGSKQLPDYYKQFKGFTERVLDTVDIAHLRCIRRGFDDGFWKYVLRID
jgi:site-specific DNA-cytosine methylase